MTEVQGGKESGGATKTNKWWWDGGNAEAQMGLGSNGEETLVASLSRLSPAFASSLTHGHNFYHFNISLLMSCKTHSTGFTMVSGVLGLILILQSEVTHPCPQARAVGRCRAECGSHHRIHSWTAGLFPSARLLGLHVFPWLWKKVQLKLQVDMRWKPTP